MCESLFRQIRICICVAILIYENNRVYIQNNIQLLLVPHFMEILLLTFNQKIDNNKRYYTTNIYIIK